MIEITPKQIKCLFRAVITFLVIVSAFFIVKCFSEFERGNKNENATQNAISFTGHGEVKAVPDIANISFTIRKESKTVKDAQDQVKEVEKKAIDALKADKIADVDMKTVDASFNPKYEYRDSVEVPCYSDSYCPPSGRNVIVGYEAYESLSIKVRNVDDTGKVMQDLGALGISELSGPNFAIEKEDSLKIEARKKAIDDAKAKAESLANDLGVKLGGIISFNEGENNPTPMYAKTMMADSAIAPVAAPAQLPKGEDTISSDVTITYEIK